MSYPECLYAECRYAECRGANSIVIVRHVLPGLIFANKDGHNTEGRVNNMRLFDSYNKRSSLLHLWDFELTHLL
jgi:hypothetical protein